MKKRFWSSEKLLSLSALLVSLLTLVVFIYQTNLIRKQQYMSVYPFLSLGNQYGGTLKYRYVLKNEGIGPALIEEVKITSPDGKIFRDLVDYVDDQTINADSIWYVHSNLTSGRLVPAGAEVALIQLVDKDLLVEMGIDDIEDLPPVNEWEESKALYDILNADDLHIEITYSSVYDESWTVKNGNIPVKNE